jgi:hypothetical protein
VTIGRTSTATGVLIACAIGAGLLVAPPVGAQVRGVIPVVRLFCAPCLDRYAQELRPRTLWWERVDGNGGVVLRSETWDRRRSGSLSVPLPPPDREAGTGTPTALVLRIDGEAFRADYVYLRIGETWTNLAWYLGLPYGEALPTLESYIRVERAPPRVDPVPDDPPL